MFSSFLHLSAVKQKLNSEKQEQLFDHLSSTRIPTGRNEVEKQNETFLVLKPSLPKVCMYASLYLSEFMLCKKNAFIPH